MGKNVSEYRNLQKKALNLSDLFSKMEGRRPRVLVGSFSENSGTDLNKIANTLSDMGFDVDISPLSHAALSLAMNALENDVDALLILKNLSDSHDKMIELEHFLNHQNAGILLLHIDDINRSSHLQKDRFKNWTILEANTKRSELGLLILKQLLNATD